jgi:hypothetical protein
MIRTQNGYLDFDGEIPMESQAVLFEDVSEVRGDFSYQFSLPPTQNNIANLGLESLNKPIVHPFTATLEDDAGVPIYSGFLLVESRTDLEINCAFFSGNSNWIQTLNVPLRNGFDFTSLDRDHDSIQIVDSWSDTSGIIFPLVDRGTLSTRNSSSLYDEDFQPFVYVKDVINIILRTTGLKIEGEFWTDSLIGKMITSNNGLSGLEKRIQDRSVYVGLPTSQALTLNTWETIEFSNVSSPYSNSPNGNWNTSTYQYTTDTHYRQLKIDIGILRSGTSILGQYRFLIDGVATLFTSRDYWTVITTKEFILENIPAGTTIEFQIRRRDLPTIVTGNSIGANSFMKVTPLKFYTAYADSLLPDLTAWEFVAQIFNLRKIIPTYDPFTSTIHTRKLGSIKNQPEIDLSQNLDTITLIDYTDFVTDYGKRNFLLWQDQDAPEVEEYNDLNATPYGGGVIEVNKDYLDEATEMIELEFVATYQRTLEAFGTSLPYLGMSEITEGTDRTVTSITDNGDDYARVNFSGDNFTANGLVRLTNMTNPTYNGDYRIILNGAGYVLLENFYYDANATGTIVDLEITDVTSDDQVLLIHQPEVDISDFSVMESFWYGSTRTSIAFAYFYFPQLNLPINESIKEALYFDKVNDPLAYQIGLIEGYRDIGLMLNDPAKVEITCYLPLATFRQLDFGSPIRLKTSRFNSRFYLNRISDYVSSDKPCTLELIKLP